MKNKQVTRQEKAAMILSFWDGGPPAAAISSFATHLEEAEVKGFRRGVIFASGWVICVCVIIQLITWLKEAL
jgi:hypothetical protein